MADTQEYGNIWSRITEYRRHERRDLAKAQEIVLKQVNDVQDQALGQPLNRLIMEICQQALSEDVSWSSALRWMSELNGIAQTLADRTCATCIHWKVERDFRGQPLSPESGVCGRVVSVGTGNHTETAWLPDMGDLDYGQELHTKPDFGCVLHESRYEQGETA